MDMYSVHVSDLAGTLETSAAPELLTHDDTGSGQDVFAHASFKHPPLVR